MTEQQENRIRKQLAECFKPYEEGKDSFTNCQMAALVAVLGPAYEKNND